jgi:hypothetical protein
VDVEDGVAEHVDRRKRVAAHPHHVTGVEVCADDRADRFRQSQQRRRVVHQPVAGADFDADDAQRRGGIEHLIERQVAQRVGNHPDLHDNDSSTSATVTVRP